MKKTLAIVLVALAFGTNMACIACPIVAYNADHYLHNRSNPIRNCTYSALMGWDLDDACYEWEELLVSSSGYPWEIFVVEPDENVPSFMDGSTTIPDDLGNPNQGFAYFGACRKHLVWGSSRIDYFEIYYNSSYQYNYGDPTSGTPGLPTFLGLMLHEVGHAIGAGHAEDLWGCMEFMALPPADQNIQYPTMTAGPGHMNPWYWGILHYWFASIMYPPCLYELSGADVQLVADLYPQGTVHNHEPLREVLLSSNVLCLIMDRQQGPQGPIDVYGSEERDGDMSRINENPLEYRCSLDFCGYEIETFIDPEIEWIWYEAQCDRIIRGPFMIMRESPAILAHSPTLRASPNPFNPVVHVSYSVPDPISSYSLDVYDMGGRHVKCLGSGYITSGIHEATWDGKDNWGQMNASGLYIIRFVSNNQIISKKVLLAK